jgi:hypothetical protein
MPTSKHQSVSRWSARLDTVLSHMHAIGANVSGAARRGSVLTLIADAVADSCSGQILLALQSGDHANWQERHLVEHIEDHFAVPGTSYAATAKGT